MHMNTATLEGWVPRYRFTEPFTGTMTIQGMTPVTVDQGPEFLPIYGWVVVGPQEELGSVLGTDTIVMDFNNGTYHYLYADLVQRATGGCECGNPWTLCHPDA